MPPDFDQRRRVGGLPFNIGAGTYRSSPDAGAWNVGLSLDNDFYFNPCTILRPRLALDYASTSMDGYTERGPADGLGLRVNADNYESFHVRSHGIMVRNQTPGRNPILQGVGPADRLPGPLASGAFWGIMDLPYGATGKIRPRRTERHMGARQRANGARRENDGADEALRAYGPGSANVKLLSKLLGLPIGQRGCELMVDETSPDRAARARKVLAALARLAAEGRAPSEWDTECLANLVLNDPAADLMEYTRPLVESPLARRQVSARTPTQRHYLAAMTANDLVFGLGPAGTGKTYLAVARAVAALGAGEVSRIIITRPAVEAGERLGFLPGDLAEKINPYLRPIYDALDDLLPYDQYVRLAERRIIEVAPLAFMRGRTLGQAFVILDEAQNCTREQMKMFLTRLGPGSRAVVTGDPDQSDLPDGQPQGLGEAVNILDGIPGIAVCRFGPADVIRHRLVRKIIEAYDQAAAGRRPAPGKMERGAGL